MAIIKTVKPEEATGMLAEVYKNFQEKMGMVPNAFIIRSSSPDQVVHQARSLSYYWNHDTLSHKLLAFIRVLVSETQQCEYCINLNTGMLIQSGVSMEDIRKSKENPNNIPLEEKDKALIKFVLKVVKDSKSTTADDMEKLRQLGWTDRDILDAVNHGTTQVSSDMIFNAFKIDAD